MSQCFCVHMNSTGPPSPCAVLSSLCSEAVQLCDAALLDHYRLPEEGQLFFNSATTQELQVKSLLCSLRCPSQISLVPQGSSWQPVCPPQQTPPKKNRQHRLRPIKQLRTPVKSVSFLAGLRAAAGLQHLQSEQAESACGTFTETEC